MRLKVDTDKNLERDTFSKSILNTDVQGYERYLAKRKALESKQKNIDRLSEDVASLKADMDSLKIAIYSLLEKIQ